MGYEKGIKGEMQERTDGWLECQILLQLPGSIRRFSRVKNMIYMVDGDEMIVTRFLKMSTKYLREY
jgi:hypothetical protein